MPSTRSGESYKPSQSSQKGYICDYGRSQSVKEAQTDKLCHCEADSTVLPSKRSEIAKRSLSGCLQSYPEGLQQCFAAQRVPDPFRSVEKLHVFSSDCEKVLRKSQHLQVT
ncbi:hypothetical protein O181_036374 [Austropuccinia psidii MF-1]|uniref:Uncharacterized protein n=1 Tax=Austropuccinia psidii MF-1 TaxID=1389203 RepID=A0A9Q3HBH7_9BASI|nr:hypothetical protein [Austropuccinia psidii MF-1]